MWFNSTVSEEPYQGLKCTLTVRGNAGLLTRTAYAGAAWLSSARVLKCSLKWGNERNPYYALQVSRETAQPIVRKIICDQRAGRKEGMTSNQHGPLMPWATHVLQWRRQWVANPQGGANPIKLRPSSDWGLQPAPMKPESLVIADQPRCGEYVLESCTHCPSSQGSR